MQRNGKRCKRLTAVLLILGLCFCMLFTGCANAEKQKEETTEPEEVSKYEEIAGAYRAEIFMTEDQSVLLYLQISEDGSFVFARDDQFESTEKGAGYLDKTEDGDDAFFYEIVNGDEVEEGEYTATYTMDDDGNIQFTSPMWFGSTSPKMIHEDDTVTYPCFINLASLPEDATEEQSDETETETTAPVDTEVPDTTAAPVQTAAPDTQPPAPVTAVQTEAPAAPQSALMEGTYQGSLEKFVDAMNSTIHYDVTVTFENGTYHYTVNITLSGTMEYTGQESYSGSYSVNGNAMSMTGKLSSGSIYGTSVTLTGLLSSFAGQQESITVFQ